MKREELIILCRADFGNKIRDNRIKEQCEICGAEEELVLHHTISFSDLFDLCCKELGIDIYREEFTDLEVINIREKMIAKQLDSEVKTVCNECHKLIHEKGFRYARSERKPKVEKMKIKLSEDEIKEFYSNIKIDIDNKFLGVGLTKDLKKEFLKTYGSMIIVGKEINWQNAKKLIEFSGYMINVGTGSKKETRIYKNIIDKNVEENIDKLINWFENEWDKKRIRCKDVQDELGMSRKAWEKMFKCWKLISYMKTNKITQNTIKGLGKTLYFFKF